MADDLISVVGGQCLIDHQITPEDGSIIATATVSIYDPAGTKVIDAASMTVTAGDGTNGYDDGAYGVKYAFTTTGQDPGNYTYAITPNTGPTIRGTFTLWPEWSALDPYVQQIQDLLQDTEMGEAQRFLSLRDYQRAINAALKALSQAQSAVTLDHETDELAATDYVEPFCLWAAGWAMAYPLANKAAHTNDPQVEAGVVSYRTIRDQRFAQGKAMMERAERQWMTDAAATVQYSPTDFTRSFSREGVNW